MPPEIVILDGYVANPGDVSWEPVSRHGHLTSYDRTEPGEIVKRACGAHIVIVNKVKLSREHFEQLPELKLVCISASGTDNVDLKAAEDHDIAVKNVVGYGSEAVAQHVFALLFELTNQIALHNNSVQGGDWTKNADWCYWKTTPVELSGKAFGIYGFGKIGKQVARIAEAFGMKVYIVSGHASGEDFPFYRFVGIEELFSTCDVISLHAPLTPDNQQVVNASLLHLMKPAAFLINTARGGLINEMDLRNVLINNQLFGAALDVLTQEPPPSDHPLLGLKNCLITPHMAWTARESRQRLIEGVGRNIETFLKPGN